MLKMKISKTSKNETKKSTRNPKKQSRVHGVSPIGKVETVPGGKDDLLAWNGKNPFTNQ